MTTGLTSLAPELIACILDVVPIADLQRTTLSLLCVLSYSSVPNWRHYLFYHVQLRTPEGVSKLIQNFKRDPGNAAFVQKLTLASWTVDGKVATEAILMLTKLKWLSLCLGVSFTPEHLEKLFRKPMSDLRYLSLRLRPYLLESNYQRTIVHSFLKTTYFDSAIAKLSDWPEANLPTISVLLDPRDVSLVPPSSLPDIPTYFFDLYKLETLVSSPLLSQTDAFRLRLPGCGIARFLCRNAPKSLPCITFLDASTSSVSVADVLLLLRSLPSLRHLVLDGCGTLDEASIKQWTEFGHDCLMINSGLKLEQVENEKFASQSVTSLEPESEASAPIVGVTRGVNILPWVSALQTITLSAPPNANADEQRAFLAAFRRGCSEALAEFNNRMRSARQRRSQGWRTVRFAAHGEVGHTLGHSGYYRVVVVDDDEFARLDKVMDDEDCPVVCLGGKWGSEGGIGHAKGCGHSIGLDVWEDKL